MAEEKGTAVTTTAKYICPECGVHECRPECKHIPAQHVGKLPPNYYCRAWNGKPGRMKYCRQRAGANTAHPGRGRCGYSTHGGNTEALVGTRTGASGRYANVAHERLGVLAQQFEADPDPLNALPELAMMRGLFVDFIERYSEWSEALRDWWDSWKQSRTINTQALLLLDEIIDELEAQLGDDDLKGSDDSDYSGGWKERIEAARGFVEKLRTPPDAKRPRMIMDITEAYRLLGEVRQQIDSIHKREAETHISRRDFMRVMGDMGRAAEMILTDDNLRTLAPQEIKKRLADAWLNIPIPA